MSSERETSLVLGGRTMPAPRTVAAELKKRLNDAVAAERDRRGEVVTVEDTYEMHRSLAIVLDTCAEYRHAFDVAAKEARLVAEEELITAFGDQDGIPNNGASVPAGDGTDIAVTLDTHNSYSFDLDGLMAAVAWQVMREHDELIEDLLQPTDDLDADLNRVGVLLTMAMQALLLTGKFEPQVSKVKAFTKGLAGDETGDRIASTVTSTTRKRTEYRGVRVERRQKARTK